MAGAWGPAGEFIEGFFGVGGAGGDVFPMDGARGAIGGDKVETQGVIDVGGIAGRVGGGVDQQGTSDDFDGDGAHPRVGAQVPSEAVEAEEREDREQPAN